ncbi:hypothetical protein [Streptomyces sp. NPDC046862]|uniref:hypothetical protein n=1 Tax=Streptomyces sp. NPDC046862 TaxID=3154603 RepID=UPI0034550D95
MNRAGSELLDQPNLRSTTGSKGVTADTGAGRLEETQFGLDVRRTRVDGHGAAEGYAMTGEAT